MKFEVMESIEVPTEEMLVYIGIWNDTWNVMKIASLPLSSSLLKVLLQ